MSGHVLPLRGSVEPWSGGRVTDAAHCILAPNASPWTLDGTNTWLLTAPASSTAVVVDPGPDDPLHLTRVALAVEETGAGQCVILLTHGHVDHAEGARSLAARLRAPVRALDPAHRLGDEGLAHGDVVDLGDWRLDVIGTPGHSGDSLCFRITHDASVLTGDTVLGRGTSLVAWPDGRLGDYLASLERLRRQCEESDTLLTGHGPALSRPWEVVDAYLAHRRARLEEVRLVVAEGVSAPAEIVAIVYADVPREIWPAAELTVRAQLEYLTG